MSTDPLALLPELRRATQRLYDTAQKLTDSEVAEASPLPGWTRGHVLTHLSRNAAGLTNLLSWGKTGVESPMYASGAARDADIEAGSGRDAAAQYADLVATADGYAALAADLSPADWEGPVRDRHGNEFPVSLTVWMRIKEVEIHHVDLAAGYAPADWPESFTRRLLRGTARDFSKRAGTPSVTLVASDLGERYDLGGGGAELTAPGHALAAWLVGRGTLDNAPVLEEWL